MLGGARSMKWQATNKIIVSPKLGDKREVIRFAVFPRRVQDKWIWLEKYIAVQEYKKYYYEYDEVVSQGIFTEKYRTQGGVGERWETIDRKFIHELKS